MVRECSARLHFRGVCNYSGRDSRLRWDSSPAVLTGWWAHQGRRDPSFLDASMASMHYKKKRGLFLIINVFLKKTGVFHMGRRVAFSTPYLFYQRSFIDSLHTRNVCRCQQDFSLNFSLIPYP